ncbi:chromatin associated protein KTI12 [Haematococcus lacustris]
MVLVVLCGQPCSGKSWVAEQLASRFAADGQDVVKVDEPSLHLQRNAAYAAADASSEKSTRGALRAAVDRAITRKSVTLMDSLNNIKGYRYELWCLARAASTKYCMVHVDTSAEQCRAWNAGRGGEGYADSMCVCRAAVSKLGQGQGFEDLVSRFERPDMRNRWDAPLFTVRPAGD